MLQESEDSVIIPGKIRKTIGDEIDTEYGNDTASCIPVGEKAMKILRLIAADSDNGNKSCNGATLTIYEHEANVGDDEQGQR